MTQFVINIDFPERFIGQEFIVDGDDPSEAFQGVHLDLCRRSRWSYFEFALGRVSEKNRAESAQSVISRIGHDKEGSFDQVMKSWLSFASARGMDIDPAEIRKINRKLIP